MTMPKGVNPVPEEFRTITPHLTVRGAAQAIEFYQRAFGAQELFRNLSPDGRSIMHSELLLGESRFFLNDEFVEHGVRAPEGTGRSPVVLHLYVRDVDAAFARAVTAGATVLLPPTDQPWGDRYGEIRDPFGHCWSLACRLEDLAPAEIQARVKAAFSDEQPASPLKKL